LALFGYDVYCASYSKHLSDRDSKAFAPLFKEYLRESDVGAVHYGTLNDLVEKVIDGNGNLRLLARNCILKSGQRKSASGSTTKPRILLIDEVDVFFSESFYGKTYDPVNYYASEETKAIMLHIWANRSNITVRDLKLLPAYSTLVDNFHPEVVPLIDLHLSMMIEDAGNFNNPSYVVMRDGKKIGYPLPGSMEVGLFTYDYRTAFAYLHEVSHYPSLREVIPEVLSLHIPCGKFSYAEIPIERNFRNRAEALFDCIMGVTGTLRFPSLHSNVLGTLECLSQEEMQIVKEVCKLEDYTICPSMYGTSKVDFKHDRDIFLTANCDDHLQTILDKIIDSHRAGCPTIVYFDTRTALNSFLTKYESRLQSVKVQVGDEKLLDLSNLVVKATEPGMVTLLLREFGRGLDFQSLDQAVEDAGGVVVIQTFFSTTLSGQIQVIGRTARQTKKGKYRLILEAQSLARQLEMTVKEITDASHLQTFFQTISDRREVLISDHVRSLRIKAAEARTRHTTSLEFLHTLLAGGDVRNIVQMMMKFSGTGGGVHNVLCVDASGSMREHWTAVIQAIHQYIAIRQELGGNFRDLVTIIQFGTNPHVILQRVTLQQALEHSLARVHGGETHYVPALAKCLEEIQSDVSGLETVMVFLTDGQPNDTNKTEIVPAVTALKQFKPSLQLFCVAFNCKLDGYLKQMTDAAQGRAIAATDVNQLKNEFQAIAREISAKYGR
jgi:Mg-chelatase subunit ChlD